MEITLAQSGPCYLKVPINAFGNPVLELMGLWRNYPFEKTIFSCNSYLLFESCLIVEIASCTVVMNCAGKMIVEFFSVAISATNTNTITVVAGFELTTGTI
jgi:hypothetical protein